VLLVFTLNENLFEHISHELADHGRRESGASRLAAPGWYVWPWSFQFVFRAQARNQFGRTHGRQVKNLHRIFQPCLPKVSGVFCFYPKSRKTNTDNERLMVCEREQHDIPVMSSGGKLNLAKTRLNASPVWCAREGSIAPPESAKRILHLKGFGGGVPPNTETTAVKPRVGIAGWQEVFVLF
jgi:hypothetical protein